MSDLKKEWFEPGPNIKTMFGEHVRKNRMRGISVEECIAATFRTLLAGEESLGSVVPVSEIVTPAVAECIRTKDAEIARLRAEVERLTAERDAHEQNYNAMLRRIDEVAAERDDLQARIDQPDAAMVHERKGKADRREIGCDASLESRLAIGRDHTRVYVDNIDCNGTVKCARSNDRRRTTGTIANRGKAS